MTRLLVAKSSGGHLSTRMILDARANQLCHVCMCACVHVQLSQRAGALLSAGTDTSMHTCTHTGTEASNSHTETSSSPAEAAHAGAGQGRQKDAPSLVLDCSRRTKLLDLHCYVFVHTRGVLVDNLYKVLSRQHHAPDGRECVVLHRHARRVTPRRLAQQTVLPEKVTRIERA